MTAKRKKGGRVTPKGTKNPTRTSKAQPSEDAQAAGTPRYEQVGKAGKQSGKVARPITHNRGNR